MPRWMAVMMAAMVLGQTTGKMAQYRRIHQNDTLTWDDPSYQGFSWARCAAVCLQTSCVKWSWEPATGRCSPHYSDPNSITASPNPAVLTYGTIQPRYELIFQPGGVDQTWEEARQLCVDNGGLMAFVDQTKAQEIREKYDVQDFFAGLKRGLDGKYYDMEGNEVDESAITWRQGDGEPTGGNQYCIVQRLFDVDIPCDQKRNYGALCKMD